MGSPVFHLRALVPGLVLSNDESPLLVLVQARRPHHARAFLLLAGKTSFAVREWAHKSTFVAAGMPLIPPVRLP